MKRDMDLIRAVLMACEANENHPLLPKVDGYTEEQVMYHCWLVADAGLAVPIQVGAADHVKARAMLSSLTWSGHEFLDAARDEGRWATAKAAAARVGGLSFELLKGFLSKLGSDAVLK